MKNFRYGLWAFALLMALWWMIDPTGIREKARKTDSELRVIPKKMGEVAAEVDKKSAGGLATKEKTKGSFDGSIDTGSGDEIAGEKILRFKDVIINDDDDVEKYVRPLKRHNIQYGWYVYINKKKADFGGSCIPLEESKKMAFDFILQIKENCTVT